MAKYCHIDTYIHGPFDIASVCGCKNRDCDAQTGWDVHHCHQSLLHNPAPSFDIATYLIHFDRGAHVAFHDEGACKLLLIKQSWMSDTEDIYGSPWQKVSGLVGCPTPFILLFAPFLGPACLFVEPVRHFSTHLLPGDTVILQIHPAFLTLSMHWSVSSCLVSSSSIFGPLKGRSPD
jgi:hypothetical protein